MKLRITLLALALFSVAALTHAQTYPAKPVRIVVPFPAGGVLDRMTRMRDPQGVYAQGGCIDTTREHAKQVHASSCDLVLPPWP